MVITTTEGILFTLARGETLSEEQAQSVLDNDVCPFDWSPLEVHDDWDGDENGVHLTQSFQCAAFEHTYRYEYVDRESGNPVLEDEIEHYADDARPCPIQCEHSGAERHRQRFVPWGVARRAFKAYDRLFPGTTLERMAVRGGFGESELVALLQAPKTATDLMRLIRVAKGEQP